ncbi:MAG: peptidoglycan DD-metalloendopeptidase family protein [Pseudomonadota bacterium]|nr:peptidoglycan DD-metalloendopeptidase family protein [Pseudomonadota bacterium]
MKVTIRTCLWLLVAVVVAGCASSRVVSRSGSSSQRGPVAVSTPKPGVTTTVKRGQNLYRIATDNGITLRDLAAWNGIQPPYTIHPGERLRLYPGGRSTASRPPASTARKPAATPKRPLPPPIKTSFGWRWPVDGPLLATFLAGEPTRQGIDIGGREGAPVRSAANGVVVYSGSGLVGYGELIIVKHDEQWLSAYGHNRKRLVEEGQAVTAGQQIAELGHSGSARDMLHFEIRYNGKPVDPLRYLPQR